MLEHAVAVRAPSNKPPQGSQPPARTRQPEDAAQQTQSAEFSWNIGNIAVHPPGDGNQENSGHGAWLRLPIQAKLEVGAVNDPLEREADNVAEQVMRMPDGGPNAVPPGMGSAPSAIQRQPATPRISSLGSSSAGSRMTAPPLVHEVLNSSGQPLAPVTRAFFETRFGHDFSRVRIHADNAAQESAAEVNAHAYTVGQKIVFGGGQFAPSTERGQRLLAHELTHTVQQQGGGDAVLRRDPKPPPPRPNLPPLEPIAQRIAQLARGPAQAAVAPRIEQGAGPVVSVVRDDQTGKIYVGLNMEDVQHGSDFIQKRIQEHLGKIADGEVVIVHDIKPGEHAEVHALDRAIQDRQARTGHPVTDADMDSFEIHNVWLRGARAGTTAARCEHCAGITRGVRVTDSLLQEETGGGNNNPPPGAGGAAGGQENDKETNVPPTTPAAPAQQKGQGGTSPQGTGAQQEGEVEGGGPPAPVTPGMPSGGSQMAIQFGGSAATLALQFLASYLTAKVYQKIAQRQKDELLEEARVAINSNPDGALKEMMIAPDHTVYAQVFLDSAVMATINESGANDSAPMMGLEGITYSYQPVAPEYAESIAGLDLAPHTPTVIKRLIVSLPLVTPPINEIIAYAKKNNLNVKGLYDYAVYMSGHSEAEFEVAINDELKARADRRVAGKTTPADATSVTDRADVKQFKKDMTYWQAIADDLLLWLKTHP